MRDSQGRNCKSNYYSALVCRVFLVLPSQQDSIADVEECKEQIRNCWRRWTRWKVSGFTRVVMPSNFYRRAHYFQRKTPSRIIPALIKLPTLRWDNDQWVQAILLYVSGPAKTWARNLSEDVMVHYESSRTRSSLGLFTRPLKVFARRLVRKEESAEG